MNDDQSVEILAVLTAAWPNQELTTQTAQLWLGMLAELHPDDAMQAAKGVVRQDHWFPPIARFLQLAEAARHGRQIRASEHRGLGTGRATAPPPPALLEATRGLLAEQQSKRHWHGGPNPCPVCGGMKRPA